MKLDYALTFDDAQIVDLHASPSADEAKEGLILEVSMSTDAADVLGCRACVYGAEPAKNLTPGWGEIKLPKDAEWAEVRLLAPGKDFALIPKKIAGFTVKRSDAGTAKLRFKISTEGCSELIGGFLKTVGLGFFRLEIEAIEPRLDFGKGEEGETEAKTEAEAGYCFGADAAPEPEHPGLDTPLVLQGESEPPTKPRPFSIVNRELAAQIGRINSRKLPGIAKEVPALAPLIDEWFAAKAAGEPEPVEDEVPGMAEVGA